MVKTARMVADRYPTNWLYDEWIDDSQHFCSQHFCRMTCFHGVNRQCGLQDVFARRVAPPPNNGLFRLPTINAFYDDGLEQDTPAAVKTNPLSV